MPPIREHHLVYDHAQDDDDDMPPLVDHPNPPMEYTFLADSFTSVSSAIALPSTSVVPESLFARTPPESPLSPGDASSSVASQSLSYRGSHGKKRDASYIPRPPNAFILFRSSFIRSQQVTGKVEGNHSNLSKIIGMYWKTLPREEREAWEAKAVIAQAEHRKRYPDWRFRPGANAMARLKFKDGGGGPSRRGRMQAKDPPDRGGGDQGGGEVEDVDDEETLGKPKGKAVAKKTKTKKETEKEKKAAQRYAKITDLLVEGKKGTELEAAVAQWERESKGRGEKAKNREISRTTEMPQGLQPPVRVSTTRHLSPSSTSPLSARRPRLSLIPDEPTESSSTPETSSDAAFPPLSTTSETEQGRPFDHDGSSHGGRSSSSPSSELPSPDPGNSLSRVSLTHMFKRSLSAPAPHHRSPYPSGLPAPTSPMQSHPLRQVAVPMDTLPRPSTYHHGTGHVRRDTISLPVHSSGYSLTDPYPLPQHHGRLHTQEPHRSFSWQEEEDQRRLENAQEHGYWWTGSAEEGEDDNMYEPRREGSFEMNYNVNTEGMGYDEAADSSFDQGYLEGFPAPPVNNPPHDASHSVNWTNVSGRLGLVAAIQDPFMHPKRSSGSSTPSSKTPPPPIPVPIPASSPIRTLSPDPNPEHCQAATNDSHSAYDYYAPYASISPVTSHSRVPASTFSTLAGWDGMSKSPEAAGSSDSPSLWLDDSGSRARWGIQPLGLRGGLRQWNEGKGEASASVGPDDRRRKVMFDEDGSNRFRYRSVESDVRFEHPGIGMGVGLGLARGTDRGLGIPYDDDDDEQDGG